MNPAYQGSIHVPPGYHGSGVSGLTTTCSVGVPGVISPLAYSPGVYPQVTPTYSVPSPLSASGHGTAAPGASGLIYDGSASHLVRSYGKSNPYGVPVSHSPAAHAYPPSISTAPSHTQSAFSHTLTQSGTTLFSAQSAYPPALHPMAPQSSMLPPQARPLYLPNGSQQSVNPALGLSPALAARGSAIPGTVPMPPQQAYYPAMLGAQQHGANVYPAGYYSPYVPGYQVNGAWP